MTQPELRKLLYCTELQRQGDRESTLSSWVPGGTPTSWPHGHWVTFWPPSAQIFLSLKMSIMMNTLKRNFPMKSLTWGFQCISCLLDAWHREHFSSSLNGQRARHWVLLVRISETQWHCIKLEKEHSYTSRAWTGPLLSAPSLWKVFSHFPCASRHSYSTGSLKVLKILYRLRAISCLQHAFC